MKETITVLIVDDSRVHRSITHNLMKNLAQDKQFKVEVKEAASGKDAIKTLCATPCDLIFVDWEMPGMNGLDFIKELKKIEKCASIPVVMITGETQKTKCLEALAAGVNDYLVKPVSRLTFEDKVLKIARAIE